MYRLMGLMTALLFGLTMAGRLPVNAGAGVVFVKADATGANNGASWADAFKHLETAIGTSPAGAEIWVATGTYRPTTSTFRQIAFTPKDGQQILGGFAGTETQREQRDPGLNFTVLSGDVGIPGSAADNSYHVVAFGANVTAATLLDGFTIQDGMATGPGFEGTSGGGAFGASGAAPTMASLIVRQNTAGQFGGGVFLAGPATIADSLLRQNEAAVGGGMTVFGGVVTLANVTLLRNDIQPAGTGGGIAVMGGRVEMTGGKLESNRAKSGGGIFVNAPAEAGVASVLFQDNTATQGGGAILSAGKLALSDSRFMRNIAAASGGALSLAGGSAALGDGLVFDQNEAKVGGAISAELSSDLPIAGARFVSNAAAMGGAIYSTGTGLSIDASLFSLNQAFGDGSDQSQGAAIYNGDGGLMVSACEFARNSTDGSGGGIHTTGPTTITDSTFTGNDAFIGGGVTVDGPVTAATVFIKGSDFIDNEATIGGAIAMSSSSPHGTVEDSSFSRNTATVGGALAVSTPSLVTVRRSDFSDNEAVDGGAIKAVELLVEDSNFAENHGTPGVSTLGAAISGDTMNVRRSTFQHNRAASNTTGTAHGNPGPPRGAAIAAREASIEATTFEENEGAAALDLLAGSAPTTLQNVTFSENAGGSVAMGSSALTVSNVTMLNNGGTSVAAIDRPTSGIGTLVIRNSIVFDDTDGAEKLVTLASDTIADSIVKSGCPAPASCTHVLGEDPLLKPLANNGGPTRTHALPLGSPAVDTGDNDSCVNDDQCGAPRPIDGDDDGSEICDMGAFELGPVAVGFVRASTIAPESAGRRTIEVALNESLLGAASVRYRVTSGTATGGKDFVLANGMLAFVPGETLASFDVILKDDLFVEERETVVIELLTPVNAILGPSRHRLTITDNERRLSCEGKPATIVGTGAPNDINGTSGVDVVVALGGADTVRTLGGNDLVCAGGGNDDVDGGRGNDTLRGNAGNDNVRGGAGRDALRGDAGADQLRGGGGGDDLRGDGGTDQLFGERGKDRIAGNAGTGDRCDGGPGTDALLPADGCEVIAGIP